MKLCFIIQFLNRLRVEIVITIYLMISDMIIEKKKIKKFYFSFITGY